MNRSLHLYFFSCRYLGSFFFCLFALPYSDLYVLLLYLTLFITIPSMTACFLMRERKGMDQNGRPSGEELEGVEGRETVVKTYYIKKSLFNKRK